MEIIRVNNTKDKDAWLLFEKTYNEIENNMKTAFFERYGKNPEKTVLERLDYVDNTDS